MKKKKSKEEQIKQEEDYIVFLRKRINSLNYKATVSEEEYEEQKKKLDRAKLKLKFLKIAMEKKIHNGKFSIGDKVRIIDPIYSNNPVIWNRDLYVFSIASSNEIQISDHMYYPVFIKNFRNDQVKKVNIKNLETISFSEIQKNRCSNYNSLIF